MALAKENVYLALGSERVKSSRLKWNRKVAPFGNLRLAG